MSVGSQIANIPSIMRAKQAAIPVFSIIDEISTLDVRKTVKGDLKSVSEGHN